MTRKNVTYYDWRVDAMSVVRIMRNSGLRDCRAVRYGLGFAVQREKSGPYWNAVAGEWN